MVTPVKKGILEAGKHAELAVTVYDQYGNVTEDLAGHSVVATARGPATVQFLETAPGVYRYGCASVCRCHDLHTEPMCNYREGSGVIREALKMQNDDSLVTIFLIT